MAYSATEESNKVGSPSARLKAFSNTPQPKPDGRQSQGVTPRSGNAGFPMNLASEAGIMKSKNSPAQRVPKILNTQHLTISRPQTRSTPTDGAAVRRGSRRDRDGCAVASCRTELKNVQNKAGAPSKRLLGFCHGCRIQISFTHRHR